MLLEATARLPRYRANLAALSSAQKSPVGTPAYSRRINRPVARHVAAAAGAAGWTPNTATAVSAALSGAGLTVLFVAEPSLPMGILVSVLLALGYVMDSVDGQLARLRGSGSLSGEWLDHTVDCVKTCLLHLAVLVSFHRFPPIEAEVALLVPMAFLVVDVTLYFGIILLPFLRRASGVTTTRSRRERPLHEWLVLPNDYGLFCWMFVLLAWSQGFLLTYSLLLAANAVLLAAAWARWWRELRSLDAQLDAQEV